nr:RNA-dependent RNA polymerase [Rhizoctonia zeae megatotivirus 1]
MTSVSRRPCVVAHSGFGKTYLARNTPYVLDIDDFIDPVLFRGQVVDKLSSGENPYKFISLPSGMGKSHIVKSQTSGPRLKDIDDYIRELMECDVDITAELFNKFKANVVDEETCAFVRTNLFRVLNPEFITLVHCPEEIPEGGNLLLAASFPLYDHRVLRYASDSWHNAETIMRTREMNLRYKNTLRLGTHAQLRSALGGLGIAYAPYKGVPPQASLLMPSKVVKAEKQFPDNAKQYWMGWKIFSDKKGDMVNQALSVKYPDGWAERAQGKLMLVHSDEDVKRIGGLNLATVIMEGKLKRGIEGNRKANLENPKSPVYKIQEYRQNVALMKKLWNRYTTKFSNVVWFEQFKLDKIEAGVIKTWDQETMTYLQSDLHTWTKYQQENDVLFQNWFMPDKVYKLKRYRSGEWNYHLAYLSDTASLLKHISPPTYHMLLELCQHYNLRYKTYARVMKTFSNMVKTIGNDWDKNWVDYIDLARLAGYSLNFDTDAYVDDLESWLLQDTKSRHIIEGSEDRFIDEFKLSVGELLSENVGFNDYTIDDYIRNPYLYAVSGSAKGVTTAPVIIVNGKPQRVKMTKRSAGFFAPEEELRQLFDREMSDNYIFDKSEPIRNRPVVNSSMDMYLKMSYLDDLVYKMINPQFAQASPIFKDFDYMRDKTYQAKHIGKKVCLPLDQSGFERQTSFRMIDAICEVIESRLDPDDLESITTIRKIQKSIHNSRLHFPGTRIDGEWITNGLSSGWKWTALFNTVINLAEFITCARMTGVNYTNLNALGDDTRVWLDDFAAAQRVLAWYEGARIDINQKLAIVSRTQDEFLRKITEKTDGKPIVRGYYTRMLVAICYRNPKSREPADVNEAIESTISNWFQLFSRIGDGSVVTKLEPCMYQDVDNILSAYGIDDVNHRVLHTPRHLGGFGVSALDLRGPSLRVEFTKDELATQVNDRSKRTLSTIIKRFNLRDQSYEMDRNFVASFASELTNRKVKEYTIVPSGISARSANRAYNRRLASISKLEDFADELVAVLNQRASVHMHMLPYQKALMVPTAKGKLQDSGFFQSIYDKTPPEERPQLFRNPEVYQRLVQRLGEGRARGVVFSGISWADFRQWQFDTDFHNLICSQFVLHWYEKGLYRSIDRDELTLAMEQLLPRVMNRLDFEIHS